MRVNHMVPVRRAGTSWFLFPQRLFVQIYRLRLSRRVIALRIVLELMLRFFEIRRILPCTALNEGTILSENARCKHYHQMKLEAGLPPSK